MALIAALVLIIRGLAGSDQSIASSYGTAGWFIILGGAVFAAGLALLAGKRWGRTIAVVAEILLLPVAWALLTDSHQPGWGMLVGTAAVAALVALFWPTSARWMAQAYGAEPATDGGDDEERAQR